VLVPGSREVTGRGLRGFGDRGRRGCGRLNRGVGGVERVGPVSVPTRARGCGCDRALRVPPVCSPVTVSAASAAAAAEAASVVSGTPSVGVHAGMVRAAERAAMAGAAAEATVCCPI
jgi:hypothetical protein